MRVDPAAAQAVPDRPRLVLSRATRKRADNSRGWWREGYPPPRPFLLLSGFACSRTIFDHSVETKPAMTSADDEVRLELRTRILAAAETLAATKQPNREIPGVDIDDVRSIALEIIEAVSDGLLISELASKLPEVAINYEAADREAIVLKSIVSDLKFATFRFSATVETEGQVTAAVSPEIKEQLDAITFSLAEARADLHNLRQGLDERSGVSVSVFGVASIEVESLKRSIDDLIPSVESNLNRNLDRINNTIDGIKQRIKDFASYLNSYRREVGNAVVSYARSASLRVGEALVSGLVALRLFVEQQLDSRKVPPTPKKEEAAYRRYAKIKDETDLMAWIKLNSEIEKLCQRRGFSIDGSAIAAIRDSNIFSLAFIERTEFTLDRLRHSMQDEKSGVSPYAMDAQKISEFLSKA
jgi:hypothetical protein